MIRRPPTASIALALLAAVALVGCRSSSGGDKTPAAATPASSATPGGQATPAASASGAIRSIDLQSTEAVTTLINDTGGEYVQTSVIYADLTGDGADDAIVPISSGGTLGDIAFVVFTMSGDATEALISEYPKDGRGLALAVVGDKLIETQPVPGPDDPECCPSMLRKTTYAWNGAALAVESVTTEVNPEGGAKGTPSGPPVSP
jgi:hypothetical protein